MARKKLTPNQIAFKKEQQRIKRFAQNAEKRGYEIPTNIVPQTPKRITKKALQNIQNLKPKQIYKKSRYIDRETGEILTGEQGRKLERQKSAQKAVQTRQRKKELRQKTQEYYNFKDEKNIPLFTDVVISRFKSELTHYPEVAQPIVNQWLDQLINEYGRDDVSEMLQKGAQAGNIITYQIAYDRTQLLEYMARMLSYLPNSGVLFQEQLMEALEYGEDWESV